MKTILIIEDDPKYRFLLRTKLEKEGYQVLDAADGKKGLETVKNTKNQVDLILLDIVMPEMDGLTFYYQFKQSLERDIPIFILTNLSITAYPSDIKYYFVKTDISLSDLVQKIREFFSDVV